ncbi:1-hydroxy-2-methyl-2-butenyl 4-diphosphate reductase [Streptomyces sparsogenes]|uniref:phosphorylase family protein n=1 Tax=Streptomyces sparsogenes TaxID=67365 RepID=UPI0033F51D3A
MAAGPAPPPHRGEGPAPLLIACALGIERFALRGGGFGAAAGPVTVLRTGMGPQAAERAVTRALAEGGGRAAGTAVIATGFCAGLAPGMHPGDLVVADETRDREGVTPCTGTAVLADALTRPARAGPGRAVHTGPLVGSGHVVRGVERARLHATGAIAVDMESAATLRTAVAAGAGPVAAVRVIVDAPEHELVRIGTLRGGISAFRVLRTVLPAFFAWHRSSLLPGGELDGHAAPSDHPGRDVSLRPEGGQAS